MEIKLRVSNLIFSLWVSLFLFSTTVEAQQILEVYTAQIDDRDRFNSSGQFLSTPTGIISQDRANVHRFGVMQPQDTIDSFFTDQQNRAKIPALMETGAIHPRALDTILFGNGGVVRIGVFGSNGEPKYLWVLPQDDTDFAKYINWLGPDMGIATSQPKVTARATSTEVAPKATVVTTAPNSTITEAPVPVLPGAIAPDPGVATTINQTKEGFGKENGRGNFAAEIGQYKMETLIGDSNWCAPHIAIRADYPAGIRPEYIKVDGGRLPNWNAPIEVSQFASSMRNLCPKFRSLLVNHNVGELGKNYITNAQKTMHSVLDGFSAYSSYQQFESQLPQEEFNRCDELAAFVNDPDKPIGVAGIQDGAFEASDEALEACINATLAEPDERRHRAHLGRVLTFRGDFQSAAEEFQAGKSKGSGTSILYLGTLKAEGWGLREDLDAGNFEWRLASHYGETPYSSVEAISISTRSMRATCEKSGPTACSDYRDHRRANARMVTVKDGEIIFLDEN